MLRRVWRDESSISAFAQDIVVVNSFDEFKNSAEIDTMSREEVRDMLFEIEMNSRENDTEFKMHMEVAPEEAMAMINQIVDNQLDEIYNNSYMPMTGNSTNAWVNAPLIQQSTSYWCGPCSVLQAASGYGTTVAGSTNAAKQHRLRCYRQF